MEAQDWDVSPGAQTWAIAALGALTANRVCETRNAAACQSRARVVTRTKLAALRGVRRPVFARGHVRVVAEMVCPTTVGGRTIENVRSSNLTGYLTDAIHGAIHGTSKE